MTNLDAAATLTSMKYDDILDYIYKNLVDKGIISDADAYHLMFIKSYAMDLCALIFRAIVAGDFDELEYVESCAKSIIKEYREESNLAHRVAEFVEKQHDLLNYCGTGQQEADE